MNKFHLASLAVLFFAAAAFAGDVDITLVTLEGDEKPTKLIGVNAEGFQTAAGVVAAKDVSEVRFGGTVSTEKPKISLRLRNGDVLAATIVSGDDSKLAIKNEVLGDLTIQNKFLDAITFRLKDNVNIDAIENFLKEAPPKEDLLLLPKGDTATGFIEKFTDKDLTFNAGGQSRSYAFDAVLAFRLAPLDEYKAPTDLRGALTLGDGSKVNGKLLGLQKGSLSIEGIDGKPWNIAVEGIRSIQFTGGKLTYLSELSPKTVDQKAYVEGVPFVYGWKRNSSVIGGKLMIGNKSYDKGISMHSFSRLVFDLGGSYAKFLAEVGVDAAAANKGNCDWKVLIDGKEAAAGRAKSGEAPKAVKLDVANAKQLELVCDYGSDDDDAGDHLNWANARLIKP